MHRIGASSRGLEAVVDDNVVNVRNRNGNGAVTLTVPVDTSLKLHTLSGGIEVDGVHGDMEIHTQNGHVTLNNISGTVTADSQNGPIRVTMDRVDSSKPLTFSTLNGLVDLTFPADLKANLTVKTSHGPVYSDFDVTLGGSRSLSERNNSGDGRYRHPHRQHHPRHASAAAASISLSERSMAASISARRSSVARQAANDFFTAETRRRRELRKKVVGDSSGRRVFPGRGSGGHRVGNLRAALRGLMGLESSRCIEIFEDSSA